MGSYIMGEKSKEIDGITMFEILLHSSDGVSMYTGSYIDASSGISDDANNDILDSQIKLDSRIEDGVILHNSRISRCLLANCRILSSTLHESAITGWSISVESCDIRNCTLSAGRVRARHAHIRNISTRAYSEINFGKYAYIDNNDDFVTIGNIGSRHDTMTAYRVMYEEPKGIRHNDIGITTGCFDGSIRKFAYRVCQEHADNPQYMAEYSKAVRFVLDHFKIKDFKDINELAQARINEVDDHGYNLDRNGYYIPNIGVSK